MDKFSIGLMAALLFACLPALASETPNRDWRLVTDRNGIQVYMSHRDESRLKTFRGITRFQLEDQYALVAVLNDYESYPKWLHFVDSAEEFRRTGPLQRWLRFTTLLPWPLANREAVLQADVVQTRNDEVDKVMVHLTNQPDQLPPDNDYIRFPELMGILGMEILEDGQIQATYELVLDPGGYIPAWLVNILLRDAPYFTLERLRRIVNRPEYQGHFYDYVDLDGPGRPANYQFD